MCAKSTLIQIKFQRLQIKTKNYLSGFVKKLLIIFNEKGISLSEGEVLLFNKPFIGQVFS